MRTKNMCGHKGLLKNLAQTRLYFCFFYEFNSIFSKKISIFFKKYRFPNDILGDIDIFFASILLAIRYYFERYFDSFKISLTSLYIRRSIDSLNSLE